MVSAASRRYFMTLLVQYQNTHININTKKRFFQKIEYNYRNSRCKMLLGFIHFDINKFEVVKYQIK